MPRPSDVALTPSISYGVATAAKLLPIASRHPRPRSGKRSLLARAGMACAGRGARVHRRDGAATERRRLDIGGARTRSNEQVHAPVSLASISSVHWSDGGLIDVDKVGAALRRRGAAFLIDATQGVGVMAMDVKRLDPDFVMFPTYKWLLGPYGRAFLYVAKRHQNGIPLEQTVGRPPQRPRREHGLFHQSQLRRRCAPLRHGRA